LRGDPLVHIAVQRLSTCHVPVTAAAAAASGAGAIIPGGEIEGAAAPIVSVVVAWTPSSISTSGRGASPEVVAGSGVVVGRSAVVLAVLVGLMPRPS
jgi:hypothetical protein